jgi:hypothetical protein
MVTSENLYRIIRELQRPVNGTWVDSAASSLIGIVAELHWFPTQNFKNARTSGKPNVIVASSLSEIVLLKPGWLVYVDTLVLLIEEA